MIQVELSPQPQKFDITAKRESTKSIIVIILVLFLCFMLSSPIISLWIGALNTLDDMAKMYKELTPYIGLGIFSLIPAYFNVSLERKQ